MKETPAATRRTRLLYDPRIRGWIVQGFFALVIACLQHWKYVKRLKSDQPYRPWDLGLVVAALIGLLGLAMIVSIILRAGPLG